MEENKMRLKWDRYTVYKGKETMKVLGIQHEYNGEDTVFVPIKDLDIYERVKYYDRYEYFNDVFEPYKVEDYHVIIKDGELHRHKVE